EPGGLRGADAAGGYAGGPLAAPGEGAPHAVVGSLRQSEPMVSRVCRALLEDTGLDLEHRTNYRFALLARLHMRSLAPLFAGKHKLSVAGWRVLGAVGRYEPIFPSDLAELTSTEPYKITRTVDRLAEMGLMERNTDPTDRRRVQVSLSARGRQVYEEVEAG